MRCGYVEAVAVEPAYRGQGLGAGVMAELEAETRSRFIVQDVLVAHRWGRLEVGDAIVFVAVAAEHRRVAFEAADFLMDQLKTRAPFWKKEIRRDGTAEWVESKARDELAVIRWG